MTTAQIRHLHLLEAAVDRATDPQSIETARANLREFEDAMMALHLSYRDKAGRFPSYADCWVGRTPE